MSENNDVDNGMLGWMSKKKKIPLWETSAYCFGNCITVLEMTLALRYTSNAELSDHNDCITHVNFFSKSYQCYEADDEDI